MDRLTRAAYTVFHQRRRTRELQAQQRKDLQERDCPVDWAQISMREMRGSPINARYWATRRC